MTTNADDIRRIESALLEGSDSDFETAGRNLLNAMGYRSERTLALSGDIDDFLHTFGALNPDTKTERDFREHAESVKLIFQVSDSEIAQSVQPDMFDTGEFDKGRAQSFVFVATELKAEEYPRGDYAQFVREINKRFPMPIVALFRAASGRITLAFVNRRVNKRDADRDVLGNVSLIREIDPRNPHRAHQEILRELSLDERLKWMDSRDKPKNFDGLLSAWLDALDTEELNKRFYKELFDWFERATKQAKFPTTGAKVLPAEEHIIRLITRMLFVWFVKEKRLIAEDLFNEAQAGRLLRNYDRDGGDSYYRAVLQNLFFATLNTEIDRRGFSSRAQRTHRDFSRYRYKSEIADADRLLGLFRQTPFINGGLFDCLDTFDATDRGGYRLDYFTDNTNQRRDYSIPNRLFFGDDGLINLFDRYKFTVEENTPAEQEVALDPELLGKVFENLLAAVNPETRETARKQTGSYYTPRAVVDYMVDEALVASLSETVQPDDGDRDFLSDKLRYLLDYADAFNDADTLFTASDRNAIVRAIAEIKILDPAVGSGAFPMSMLHKLTLALHRLDERNQLWEAVQKEKAGQRAQAAFDTADHRERDAELREISATFQKYRTSDFGRKLYLIQNSIFGVDIQPVATQIAKLRFFISLAIEQQPDYAAENYGIKPLPNLETRFVAANTLVPLYSQQGVLTSTRVEELQRELDANREGHFHANTRNRKKRYIDRDGELRTEFAEELIGIGFEDADAEKIALWDPFDQNATADWFDAEYMFGISDGFHVVIGNPPYVRSEAQGEVPALRDKIVQSGHYDTLFEKWDLFIPFIEQGFKLLKHGGFTTMIVSDAYCHARYARKSREYFLKNARIARLDFFSKIQIFEAGVHNITYLFQKTDGKDNRPERRVHSPEFGTVNLLPTESQRDLNDRVFFPEDTVIQEFRVPTIKLSDICYVSYGLRPSSKPNAPERFVTANLTSETQDEIHCKPYVDGKHLDYWLPATNLWIEWNTERSPSQLSRPTFNALHNTTEKILVQKNPGPDPKACYDNRQLAFSASVVGVIPWNSLSGIRNNSIKKQARYEDEKQLLHLPMRKTLEESSEQYSILFLLGVLNSTVVRHFLRVNRRHNVSLYPDDWKKIPIPDIPMEGQISIIALVDKILAEKTADPQADTSDLEEEIDWLVYDLYDLTDKEVTAIADALWDGEVSEEEEDAALVRAIEAGLAEDDERFDISVAKEILSEFSEGRI